VPPVSQPPFSATLLAPSGGEWAQIRLAGEIGVTANSELAAILDQLTEPPLRSVYVDVAAVTVADSTLANFCVLLRACVPAGAVVSVCRPGPMIRMILRTTGVDQVVIIRDDMPLLDVSRAGTSVVRRRARPRWSPNRGPGPTAP
jgi:anti-anti-sigma regulatory factor